MAPIIDEVNIQNVHHFLIYECTNLNSTLAGYSAPCSGPGRGVTGEMVAACTSRGILLAAWAVGGGVSCISKTSACSLPYY